MFHAVRHLALATLAYASIPAARATAPLDIGIITDDPILQGQCDFQTGYLQAECIPLFVAYLVTLVFGFLGFFFVVNVMIAGYQIAIGSLQGDKGTGIERLRWSVYGFVLTACSYFILDLAWNLI